MKPFKFDMSEFPLVRMTTVEVVSSADDVQSHFDEYDELIRRNQPYVIVCDATRTEKVDAVVRKRYADYMTQNQADLQRLCAGCAFAINSPLVRGVLTAVLWIAGSLPFPHKIFGTIEEAEAWARERMPS